MQNPIAINPQAALAGAAAAAGLMGQFIPIASLQAQIQAAHQIGASFAPVPLPAATSGATAAGGTLKLVANIQNGKVACPYCTGKSLNLGGSRRGVQYLYMCESCGQRWNQNIDPDSVTGDYDIRPSNRKIGDEPRRSGGYPCGKRGAKPKFGHICPFKNIDPTDAANFFGMAAAASAMADMTPLVSVPMQAAAPVMAAQ
eukprot:7377916-Prymnesium_polylepis.1